MTADPDKERSGPLGDILRKALSAGVGAIFLTEESIRNYVKDAKLPRDLARSVVQNASRGKEELVTYLARELNSMITRMDLSRELEQILQRNTVRIRADIEFIPKSADGPSEPGTRAEIELIPRVVDGDPADLSPETEPSPPPPD